MTLRVPPTSAHPEPTRLVDRPGTRTSRRTIAAFFDYMNPFCGGYQSQVRAALDEECRARDLDLWLVFGRGIDEPDAQCASYNAIFELIHPDHVDGVIVLSTCLAAHCGAEGIATFVRRYRPMPLCSMGIAVPSVPSVVVDNRQGISAVMEHMITHHGCRRPAFIAGTASSPEADARLRAYRAALERHGIAFDPARVAYGDFQRGFGGDALEEILERGEAIDAVVAANDLMALGAIEALRKRGYRVPDDLPVTGFDDLAVARLEDPPLTTVAQPFAAMAQYALGAVLDQIAGREVPEVAELPAPLVLRRSCGCASPMPFFGSLAPVSSSHGAGARTSPEELGEDFHVDSSRTALQNLRAQQQLCRESDQLRTFSPSELNDLWSDAWNRATLASQREQAQHRMAIDEALRRIVSVGEQISVALDLPTLSKVLRASLPRAGIRTAFLSRYVDANRAELEAFLALHEGQNLALPSSRFPAPMLLPPGACPAQLRHTLMVFPLAFDTEALGVAVFEQSSDTHGYQMIRDQIAAQLRSVALHQEVVETTMLHERIVHERAASQKRMESLAVLAGGVAHDLNNVLGPILALPDILLGELSQLTGPPQTIGNMGLDLESIRGAAVRASHTIKDLLTLSRQGMTTKENLDVNGLVQACRDQQMQRGMPSRPGVKVSVEPASVSLVIWGSAPQLERALANLVRNAIEAIAESGVVRVSAAPVRVLAAMPGYETVPPGDYVALTVADDGRGISADDLPRIFEPFFTRKRELDSGGTGLGLAIVHGVVKDHGGYLDVTSEPGRGTSVTLYLPRAYEAARMRSLLPVAGAGPARILIVDDEPVQRRTGRRVLSYLGYQVETMDSGQKAYQLFAEAARHGHRPYDLVIMDVILNEAQDGLEILERIHQLFPEQKAIVASGHAPSARARLAVSRGVRWLVKPYTTETLAHGVRSALEGSDVQP